MTTVTAMPTYTSACWAVSLRSAWSMASMDPSVPG
jgi:hypothetical protein